MAPPSWSVMEICPRVQVIENTWSSHTRFTWLPKAPHVLAVPSSSPTTMLCEIICCTHRAHVGSDGLPFESS